MNSLPPALIVFMVVVVFVLVAMAFGFRLKTKVQADDTIVSGLASALDQTNARLSALTQELDRERSERHKETSALRNELSRVNAELERTIMTLDVVRKQVRRLGEEPIA